jgi:NADH dehydrogenase
VDADAGTVRIGDDRELPYDTLVYALGGVAGTSAVRGLRNIHVRSCAKPSRPPMTL